MYKILFSVFFSVLFISCGSNNTDKKEDVISIPTEEVERVKYIRDYFKGMNALTESDFKEIETIDTALFVTDNDTLVFEGISFEWAKQFNEAMLYPNYKTAFQLSICQVHSNSKPMLDLAHYLKTDEEFETTEMNSSKTKSIEEWMVKTNYCFINYKIIEPEVTGEDTYESGYIKGALFFIDQDLNPIGKISVEAINSEQLDYDTPNYDEELHLKSSLSVDLDKNFIKQAELDIQELLNAEIAVRFKR